MSRKKRIVFVLSGYGRYARGAERFVADIIKQVEDEFDCRVLGAGGGPRDVRLPMLSRESKFTRFLNRAPGAGHFLRLFQLDPLNWEWLTCCAAARGWLRRNPCDLLVPEGGRWAGWLGRWYRNRTGTPFVDIGHGAPSRWEFAAARSMPDCYVALTAVAAAEMRRAVPALRVRVIPPGVDTTRFCPIGEEAAVPLRAPIVMAVGALEPMKRMDCVVRAIDAWGRGSLLLVGDGPMRQHLCRMGEQRLGRDRFHWRTAQASDMPAHYRAADVLMSASESEAFTMVFLEAMASGLPIVTHDDAMRREMAGPSAWYGNAADPQAMAHLLEEAVRCSPSEAARQRALEFDVGRMGAAFRRLFRDVIAARQSGEARIPFSP